MAFFDNLKKKYTELLNPVKKSLSDDTGWFRQGQFTPIKQIQKLSQTARQQQMQSPLTTFGPLVVPNFRNQQVQEQFKPLTQPFKNYANQGLLAGQTALSVPLQAMGVNYGPSQKLIKKVQDVGMLSKEGKIGGNELRKSGINTANVILKTAGLANPALMAKSAITGGILNSGVNTYQNIKQKQPLINNLGQSFQQGMVSGMANAGTTRLTSGLVGYLSKSIPALKPLTDEALSKAGPVATDTLKKAIGKWLSVSGKKLFKGAVIETLVETPIWATLTQGDQEKFKDAILREAEENLKMNILFAGVDSALDAKTLAPIVKKSLDETVTNYFKKVSTPEGIAKQGGYIDMFGNIKDGTARTQDFDNARDILNSNDPKITPQQKLEAQNTIDQLGRQMFSKKRYTQLSTGVNADKENLMLAIADKIESDIKTNKGYMDIPNLKLQRQMGRVKLGDDQPFPQQPRKSVEVGETKKTTEDVLPWETPEYVAKYGEIKTPQTQTPKSGKLKQELLQRSKAETQSSKTILSPELKTDIFNVEKVSPKKVNLLDYFRTPDRVLKKIGLEKEGQLVRVAYNNYLDDLPKEIGKITNWYEQVKGNQGASQRIFKYLDGQKVALEGKELKVAQEMREYLKDWADKLDLPYDKRIANYITHIFEKDFIKKDFDDDLAKIIAEKVPGSVYDPFLQKRLGKMGYVEDVFRALDAYTKRAVRKFHMDPALNELSRKSDILPLESWKYVKSLADRVNLRPTDIDTMIDNLVKESPIGYKLGVRPVTYASKKVRQAVYRGTLGLNFGSALRNLTQGTNTYAKLGEKYTGIGYIRAIKEMVSGGDELEKVGVLRDNVVQDRQLSAVKGVMEKIDKGLFVFFNIAEKLNRGSAYFGAKAKYLSQGLSEPQAIKKAIDLVRDTQFAFGSIDTPLVLSSDLAKTLGQFQSFNIKQTEFLGEMINGKDVIGMLRWIGANAVVMATVGKLIGIDLQDIVPFGGVVTGDSKLGETPPVKLIGDIYKAGINAPDKYGNISNQSSPVRIKDALIKNAPAFIPAGSQIKKTVQGIKSVTEEGSFSKTGRLQYPIKKTTGNYIRAGLFGKSNLPAAKEYFKSNRSVLGEKQTEEYKNAINKIDKYNEIIYQREQNSEVAKAREQVRQTGETVKVGDIYLYKTQQVDTETQKMKDVVRSVDLGKQIPELKLTGQIELDKKLTSAYNSAISSKITDITKLVQLGQLDAKTAETQINELQKLKISLSKSKKPKKVTFKKPKVIKLKAVKIKYAKIKMPKIKKVKAYKRPRIKKMAVKRVKLKLPKA